MEDEKRNFLEERCIKENKKKKPIWVGKTWCVSIRLSFSPAPVYYTHISTSISKLAPLFLRLSVVWPQFFARSQKLSFNTAKDVPLNPPALPPNPILHIASWDIGTSG